MRQGDQVVYSNYKQGSGRFYVWRGEYAASRFKYPAQGKYYACYGDPSEGYSGYWFDTLEDAREWIDDLC